MGYYFKPGYSIDDEKLTALSYKLAEQFVDQIEEADKLKKAINQSIVEHQDICTVVDFDKLKSLLGIDDNESLDELISDALVDTNELIEGVEIEEESDDSETRFF